MGFKIYTLCTLLLLTASCGSGSSTKETDDSTAVAMDSSAFKNIILRDSVTLLKYKNKVDTISFPVINPMFRALAKSVTPEEILGERIFGIKENYENCGCGYTYLSYQNTFSNSKVISLIFQTAFLGPYPSETTIYKTLSIKTGKAYTLTNQLTKEGQDYVLKSYQQTLSERLEADKSNHPEEDYQAASNQIKESVVGLTFQAINDNYIVNNDSIIVKTEPILPHVTLVWEINRKVSFSLEELKKFRKNTASL